MERNIPALREQYRRNYGELNVDLAQAITNKKREKGVSSKNPTAMNHLYQIVGTSNLKQDIKRIKGAQTLEGANKWITSNKKEGLYRAVAEDIDNDGINDILIRDVKGNLVVVNGYTVRKSDYPYRQMFYNLPEDERKEYKGYKEYINDSYYGPVYNEETGEIDGYRYNEPKEDLLTKKLHDKGFKTLTPKKKSPYQMFTSQYIKRMYDYVIERYNLFTADGKKPNVFVKLASIIWNEWVIVPVLQIIYGEGANVEAIMADTKNFNKLKAKADFKKLILSIVNNYFIHSDETNIDLLSDIHDKTVALVDEWYASNGKEKNANYGAENRNVEFETVVPESPQRPNNQPNMDEAEI